MRALVAQASVALFILSSAHARAGDAEAAMAREQLKRGYALKKDGKCAEAMPFLAESERLDPRAKTLLNMAECEEVLGLLADASGRLAEARDRARLEARTDFEQIASERLAALEKRIPRLTIVLASGAPASTEVMRDGTLLGAPSLGAPLPANPGVHSVVVRAEGFPERRYAFALREGESKTMTVAPDREATTGSTLVGDDANVSSAASTSPSPGSARAPALVAFGIGAVGLGVGVVFGLKAFARWADAKDQCGAGCDASSAAFSSRDAASSSATISTVGFVVAGVGTALGTTLWILTSPQKPTTTGWSVSPTVAPGAASLTLQSRFR